MFPDVAGLEPPNAGARDTMDELAGVALSTYRRLVWDDPAFPAFFRSFTPVDELALLEIGSRPASRPEAAAAGELEALRAIPWVFAWTQNRCLLPAWYGCGSAFSAYGLEGERLAWLRRLYAEWPFFRALVENLEMTLAKSSFEIAESYVSLCRQGAIATGSGLRCQTSIGERWTRCSPSSRPTSCSTAIRSCSARSACATRTSTR